MPDILDAITAIHSHEERYEKIELLFRDNVQKEKILKTISKTPYRKECQVEVSIVEEGEERGFVCVEFHDDYDKEAGPFIDTLLDELGINRCE